MFLITELSSVPRKTMHVVGPLHFLSTKVTRVYACTLLGSFGKAPNWEGLSMGFSI